MKEILGKIQELLGMAETKNRELDGLIASNKAVSEQHKLDAESIVKANQDLIKRESAVAGIEEITKMKSDAIALQAKAEKAMESFVKEYAAFNKASEAKTAEIIANEKAIRQEWEAIRDAGNKLAEGNKKLDEDKAKIKEAMKKLGV